MVTLNFARFKRYMSHGKLFFVLGIVANAFHKIFKIPKRFISITMSLHFIPERFL